MSAIRVGKPDVRPDTPSHTKGVESGNTKHRQRGLHKDGTADARRSTGIRPKHHNATLPIMPNLPPG
jgi:hypothetical protein